MLEKVKYGDAQRWADSLLYDLQFRRDYDAASSFTPIIDSVSFKGSYAQARRRFFFLDYDGTLAGIVRIPSAAVPTPEALAMLRALTQDERNTVYIVSGRDRATLDAWLGKIPRLGFSAEHGCFLRGVNQAEWTAVEACTDDSWKEVVLPVLEYFTERTVGSFIEHKSASLVWHYRLADPDFGYHSLSHTRTCYWWHVQIVPSKGVPCASRVGHSLDCRRRGHFGQEEPGGPPIGDEQGRAHPAAPPSRSQQWRRRLYRLGLFRRRRSDGRGHVQGGQPACRQQRRKCKHDRSDHYYCCRGRRFPRRGTTRAHLCDMRRRPGKQAQLRQSACRVSDAARGPSRLAQLTLSSLTVASGGAL